MKSFICLLALATVALSSVISPEHGNGRHSGRTNQGPIPIGEVDGKMYYVDFEYKQWQTALQHCHALGDNMDLASITTRTQMDFLVQAFNEAGYTEDFWTAGRDARSYTQYMWDHSGEPVTGVVNFASSPWYQTCLAIRPAPNNGTKLFGVHCEKTVLAVLCEQNLF